MNSLNKPAINRRDFLQLIAMAALTFMNTAPSLAAGINSKKISSNRSPNIILLLFDALSARHMSTYGYHRSTTPNISDFAKRSNVYLNHYSTGNFTSPGTASLLTGVYPWTHRAFNFPGTVIKKYCDDNIFSNFSSNYSITTYTHNIFAQLILNQFRHHIDNFLPVNQYTLVGEKYSERLFPSDFPAAYFSERILRGEESKLPGSILFSRIELETLLKDLRGISYDLRDKYPRGIPTNYNRMFFILETAIDSIMEQAVTLPKPYFMYYHLFPPHKPYLPRAEFINIFDDGLVGITKPPHTFSQGYSDGELNKIRQQYDEYIAFMDSEFGRLLSFFEAQDVLSDSIIIITSDHGDLFERGIWEHNTPTLYEDIIKIPLLISLPNQTEGKFISTITSSIDVAPTILSFSNKSVFDISESRILPGFGSSLLDEERSIYAFEAKSNSKSQPLTKFTVAMMKERYKLIHYSGYGDQLEDEFYDLENDPEEIDNLSRPENPIQQEMTRELIQKIESVNQAVDS